MALAVGYRLQDKYEIRSVLGEGGMGTVYLAEHIELERLVAVKVLSGLGLPSSSDRKRFLREAKLAARLQSENVIRVLDFSAAENRSPYIVLEYLQGRDLSQILAERGAIDRPTAVRWLLEILSGVAEAHAIGIVHRDLKPSNLFLVNRSDGVETIKVMDFGLSKSVFTSEDSSVTDTAVLMGTPAFSAPEVLASARRASIRSDLWAIGVIAYQLLSAELPFKGASIREVVTAVKTGTFEPVSRIVPGVPPALDAIITRALAPDPDARFEDAAAFAFALAPFGGAEGRALANRVARLLGKMELPPEGTPPSSRPPHTPATLREGEVVVYGPDSTPAIGPPLPGSVTAPAPLILKTTAMPSGEAPIVPPGGAAIGVASGAASSRRGAGSTPNPAVTRTVELRPLTVLAASPPSTGGTDNRPSFVPPPASNLGRIVAALTVLAAISGAAAFTVWNMRLARAPVTTTATSHPPAPPPSATVEPPDAPPTVGTPSVTADRPPPTPTPPSPPSPPGRPRPRTAPPSPPPAPASTPRPAPSPVPTDDTRLDQRK